MAVIQRWKDRGLTPDRVTPAEDTDFANGRSRELYAAYQERLRTLNSADFGDLLLHMTEILRSRPDVLAQYHRIFRYILVDEYQDTNLVQYLWLRLLAQGHHNICCVGDDDQSIYSWRGAEVENILRFEKDFPESRIVRLEANYRSTKPILAAASALIAHNEGRLGKTLRAGRKDADGEKVRVVSLWDSDEEARMVGERVETWRRDGDSLAEMAILVRAGFQTRAFEERLITLGVPYRVVGGLRFYERAEIRDAIAYMRVLNQPADDLAFERIVNVPRRGVGEAALRTMHQTAREQGVPLTQAAARLLAEGGVKGPGEGIARHPAARFCPVARDAAARRACRYIGDDARRERLHGDVEAGQVARGAGAAGEPEGAGARAGRFRDAGGLPRSRRPGDGERGERRGRPGQPDDPARRQGARIRHRFPARLGGGLVSQSAGDGRIRAEGLGGGAAARLCRADPRAPPGDRQPRRQPAHLRQLAEQHPQPLRRGIAGGSGGAHRLGGAGARGADRASTRCSAASFRWWRGGRR